jgi:hypothetical protein
MDVSRPTRLLRPQDRRHLVERGLSDAEITDMRDAMIAAALKREK